MHYVQVRRLRTIIVIEGKLGVKEGIGNERFEKKKRMEKGRNIDPAGAYLARALQFPVESELFKGLILSGTYFRVQDVSPLLAFEIRNNFLMEVSEQQLKYFAISFHSILKFRWAKMEKIIPVSKQLIPIARCLDICDKP